MLKNNALQVLYDFKVDLLSEGLDNAAATKFKFIVNYSYLCINKYLVFINASLIVA